MGESLGLSYDILQKILSSSMSSCTELVDSLYSLVRIHVKRDGIDCLIADDTTVAKQFGRLFEKLDVWNTADAENVLGFKLVVLAWTNGKVTIPVDFKYWFKGDGKTKLDLAKEIIVTWRKKVPLGFDGWPILL